ncbi:neuronal PAS domain-containing protein 2-like isoform X2 [Onthophagus taurus]|uniref:neuronal PAS domain-containing protein 2-like isoform X2 n=1 Tax=Onthophagus taurus TaxID=166361 RepID=UPI000C20B7F8|nr:neuronal PAS domain-containing protein 2-like isoform X2 [Onthophagus taurus]
MSLLATMYGQGYNANGGAYNWYPSAAANQLQSPMVPNMVHPQHQQHLRGQYAATSTTSYHHLMEAPPSREMRNRAEKMRRDKLNAFIGELATLVPMVSRSAKRMDKTSILRLTASHLRIHQRLLNRKDELNLNIPDVDQSLLEDLVQDQLRGFLMILTTSGKIVFVSQAVEHLLGHLQTDLMGQSIFNLISADDTERFRMYISTVNDISDNDWRKYFNMHLKRAGPRNEAAVYEVVNITGTQLRDPTAIPASSSNRELAIPNLGSNDLWIFFMRVLKTDLTIEQTLDTNDEYITRHLLDGRIINCDHRISFIAGYLKEEVSGVSAFKYMHREEVRWVMIALRQMYDRGESRGSSCYRLLSRTGQFIYLRTTGYLEIDNTGTVESFICVNAVVSEREGQELIKQMKERYSALIKNGTSLMSVSANETEAPQGVDDPQQLDVAIAHLLHRLPSPDSDNESNSSPRSVIGESQDFNHSDTNHSTTSSSSTTNYTYCFKGKGSGSKRPPPVVSHQEASSATKRHKKSQSSDDGLGDSISTTSPSSSSLTSTSSLPQGYHITDISDNR